MKKINNISKGLENAAKTGVPAVPSLASAPIKINCKPVPPLHNFVKSHTVSELENRKVEIPLKSGFYKLKKYTYNKNHLGQSLSFLILSYKLGKTKYKIHSCTKLTQTKMPMKTYEGYIKITKGFFNSREFKLQDLPKDIVDSINENIELFNGRYVMKLGEIELKRRAKEEKKSIGFFNGLDT